MVRKYHKLAFKDDWDIGQINTDLPISLKDFEKVVEKVYIRYPLIPKSKVSIIIKLFMEELREQLLKGKTINIYDFASGMRLYSYYRMHNNKINITTTVQLTTPRRIREVE